MAKSELIQAPRASKTLPIVGIIFTVLWLGLVLWYAITTDTAFIELSPNEIGDFAAGAFAPLAFLWLVLGYFQQGEELRHSGRALWLQGQELQNSVEQQRELVKVTREQLQFESTVLEQQREEIARNAQPLLVLAPGGSMGAGQGTRIYGFRLLNHGRPCTGLTLEVPSQSKVMTSDLLPLGGTFEFNLELSIDKIEPFDVVVSYFDERMSRGAKTFIVGRERSTFNISEKVSS